MKVKIKSSLAKFATTNRGAVANNEAASAPKSAGNLEWMQQSKEEIRQSLNQQKAQAARRYPPEFWLRTDEEKQIRFRKSEPIGSFAVYSLKTGPNQFTKVTAPPAGQRDLFREAGRKASFRALYEILDVTGYVGKDGKQHTNVPRFLVANSRLYEQLEAIRAKKGGLTKFNLSIKKTGKGVNTSYVLIPEDPEPLEGVEKIPSIAGDAAKYYAPPSIPEQEALLGSALPDER